MKRIYLIKNMKNGYQYELFLISYVYKIKLKDDIISLMTFFRFYTSPPQIQIVNTPLFNI